MNELDPALWKFEDDVRGRAMKAATEALQQIGWQTSIAGTRLAKPHGPGGPINRACVEVWCVKLIGVEPEIYRCCSGQDMHAGEHAAMVTKFAATFDAWRTALESGRPLVQSYEGMRAANIALDEFHQLHAGHSLAEPRLVGEDIVNRCLTCGDEFREEYTPVTSN